MSNITLAQLYAIRTQVEAAILQMEQDMGIGPQEPEELTEPGKCPHPDGKQVDASVMGGPRTVLCLECGQERAGVFES